MIPDDRMEQLLRETFQAHEHLADAPPARTASVRRPARLLVAAAAVAAVALGGAYGGIVWLQHENASLGVIRVPDGKQLKPPPSRVLRTDAQNRAYTMRLVQSSMESARKAVTSGPGGATPVTATDVPPLRHLTTFLGGGDPIIRSMYFLTDNPDAHGLAVHYVVHPPDGLFAPYDGRDPDNAIGDGNATPGEVTREVTWSQTGVRDEDPGNVQLLVQLASIGDQTGIRVTAFGTWIPARPAESFLDDPVTSIDLTYRPASFPKPDRKQAKTRHASITDTQEIAQLVSSYNSMTGSQEFFHSCPITTMGPETLRATFHTASRDLTIRWLGSCYRQWEARSAGNRVGPYLTDTGLASMIEGLARRS